MEPKRLGKKSKEQWTALWKRALEIGACPYDEKCNISTKTCEHLDAYLVWGTTRKFFEPEIDAKNSNRIEDYPEDSELEFAHTEGVWSLFCTLRKLPLDNDQILIMIRKHGLKQGRRQILREMHWTSVSMYQRRYRQAVRIIRSRGIE